MIALRRGIRAGAARGRAELVRRTPKDQGHMKAAWRDTGASVAATDTASPVAEVYNDAPYAGIVEAGARPHAVSEEGKQAILEWVKRHLPELMGHDRAAFIKRRKWTNYAEMEAKEIMEAIVWRIRTKGQPPTYFIRDTLPKLSEFAAAEVARELRSLANGGRPS